jgi:hypothetical protein
VYSPERSSARAFFNFASHRRVLWLWFALVLDPNGGVGMVFGHRHQRVLNEVLGRTREWEGQAGDVQSSSYEPLVVLSVIASEPTHTAQPVSWAKRIASRAAPGSIARKTM